MGKGLKTKGGRIVQLLLLGANPNLFDPNGRRIVCSNFEEYSYEDGTEHDKIRRQGAKALHANAPLEAMHTGTAKGPIFYNLVDDQILPFLIANPISDTSANGFREREYRRPQFQRADRAFFAIQEGLPTDCELGGFGMLTSFKFSSKRGNKGTARFDLGFVTQAAVPFGAMTGGVQRNSRWTINASNVTGDLIVGYQVPGGLVKQVTMVIADAVATTKGKFEANGDGITVTIVGQILTGAGEKHTLVGTGQTVTIYGDVVIDTAVDTIATIQAKIRAKAGRTTATVTGTVTKPNNNVLTGGTATATPVGGTAANAIDGNTNTVATFTNQHDGQNPQAFTLSVDRGAGAAATAVSSVYIDGVPNGFNPGADSYVETSVDGSAGSWTKITANFSYNPYNTNPLTVPCLNGAVAQRYVRWYSGANQGAYSQMQVKEFAVVPSNPTIGALNLQIAYDSAAGNLGDIEAAPGAGYVGTSTQPGNAGGSVTVEFTAPANSRVLLTKISGHAGYTLQESQPGSDGNVIGSIVEPNPVLPGHILLYRSDTYAGLNDSVTPANSNAGALVGQVQEFDYDDSKICTPVSHHVPINDPLRPYLPPTYDSFAEEETEEESVKLTVTLDVDDTENGHVTTLLANSQAVSGGGRYISKPSYWRIEMISPKDGSRIRCEFYGSIGVNVPRKFNGNIEQRTFVIDLIENRELPWALRWITRVPV